MTGWSTGCATVRRLHQVAGCGEVGDCNGFEVETLMGIRAAVLNLRVVEIPSWEANRRTGESNLKAGRDGARVARTIIAEWVRPS